MAGRRAARGPPSRILVPALSMKFRNILLALVGLLVVIVVLQNTETVETEFLFASLAMPRALLLFLTFLLGIVTGLLIAARPAVRRGSKSPS